MPYQNDEEEDAGVSEALYICAWLIFAIIIILPWECLTRFVNWVKVKIENL
jgi:hypothetical protein